MKTIIKTEKEWKKDLTEEQFLILRKKGTEPAFSGRYVDLDEKGIYCCSACKSKLFSSDAKFHSGSGWPSFFDAVSKEKVVLEKDSSFDMRRVEVRCARCNSHLGHVFNDGPRPTGKRYCINSVALEFLRGEKNGNDR